MRAKPIERQRGLTLIELMIGLAIAAIVLLIGIPSLYNLFMISRMANAANSVLGHLQYARMEAVTRHMEVVVCPSTDGDTCEGGGNPQDWSVGYIVATRSGGGLVEVLRRVSDDDLSSMDFSASIFGSHPGFVFYPDGSATNGSIHIEDPNNAARFRDIVVNNVGRAYVRH